LKCGIKLCPVCKSNHDRKHHIINYDQKDYICNKHNNGYIKYCNECKKNFCLKCEKEHKGHQNTYFGNILLDEDELIKIDKKLKENMIKFNKDILNLNENKNIKDNNMLTKENIKKIIKNIEIYYNQFNNLINIYNDNILIIKLYVI
jgi:coproporphyrinogen III oxidase